MAWRFVQQPNGRLAVFSDIVDGFTGYDFTDEEAFAYAFERMGRDEAHRKVRAGREDWRPWTVEHPGSGSDRWWDSLETIYTVHGRDECVSVLQEMEVTEWESIIRDLDQRITITDHGSDIQPRVG